MKIYQLLETPDKVLFHNTGNIIADKLSKGEAIKITDKFTSFVRNKKELKSEFGPRTISCKQSDLPIGTQIIDIRYDLAWFTQSPLHKKLLMYVTSRTEQDLLDEFDNDIDAIDDELETIYGDEKEVIVVGLKQYHPQIFKVVK